MPGRWNRGILGFFILVIALAVAAGVGLQAADMTHVLSSTGPNGYVGIVTGDFDADGTDEIVGDFGTIGVWLRNSGNWTRLTTDNPEWMFVVKWGDVTDYEVVADFGAKGLWQWNYPGTWTQLTTSNADGGFATDDDQDGKQEIQIDFGTLGLWRYDLDGSWTQYTTQNPYGGIRSDLYVAGWEEGVWRFSNGLWAVYWQGGPSWWQLTATTTATEDMAAANFIDDDATSVEDEDELIVEFGTDTWLWNNNTWTMITETQAGAILPARFSNNPNWELVFAEYPALAPWIWYDVGTWGRMSTSSAADGAFAVRYDPDAHATSETAEETEVVMDFGSLGLWEFNYSTAGVYSPKWTQITTSNAVSMVPLDYWMDGHQMGIVVNFGSGTGLWLWDGLERSWSKLTDSIPDGAPAY